MIGTSFARKKKSGISCKVDNKQENISLMILNYLHKNPEAGDTLEGITRWWLQLERIESSVNEVGEAVEMLIQKGLIRIHRTKGGTTFYKINNEI